jgi:hypothetical protein
MADSVALHGVSDDLLRVAIAAHLARYKGLSRAHTSSDLQVFLRWCAEHQLDPLSVRRVDVELFVRWLEEIRRFKPSTVSRRLSVVTCFYRTFVIDAVLDASPAAYVRRPPVSSESPTFGLSHLQLEAMIVAARTSTNLFDFAACVRMPRLHPHMLRHTFVTTMLDAGVSLRDVQIAARHADPKTTMRYDRARKNLDRHPNYISRHTWPPEPDRGESHINRPLVPMGGCMGAATWHPPPWHSYHPEPCRPCHRSRLRHSRGQEAPVSVVRPMPCQPRGQLKRRLVVIGHKPQLDGGCHE